MTWSGFIYRVSCHSSRWQLGLDVFYKGVIFFRGFLLVGVSKGAGRVITNNVAKCRVINDDSPVYLCNLDFIGRELLQGTAHNNYFVSLVIILFFGFSTIIRSINYFSTVLTLKKILAYLYLIA